MKKIKIKRTKKGFPAVWEKGGGLTNTGEATIIAGKYGQPKEAIYIRRRGPLANGEHALVVLEVGDYIIEANHHRRDFVIRIWCIDQIQEEEARLTLIHEYSRGEWDAELPAYLEPAVQAAKEKATCYHCRKPHFIVE
jgi:hypothetical protein